MPEFPFVVPFVRWADVAVLPPRRAVEQRRLYDHELVYVMSGRGHIVIENCAHEAILNRLFLVQPRVWHCFSPDASTPLHLLGVHFDWTPQHDTLTFPIFSPANEPVEEHKFRARREIPNWDLNAQPFLEFKGRNFVRRALENVVAEYAQPDENARESAGALLAHAIFLIAREAKWVSQFSHNLSVGPDAIRRVHRARELFESTPHAPLAIDEVASRVGWSADHLRRMFRQVLQSSPLEVQLEARLRHAQQLLKSENLKVSEIAGNCGFDDASHFARIFKKRTGLTPRQYLRLAKKI